MAMIVRLLREPLLHFLVIGGLIFLLYGAAAGPSPEPGDTIVVGTERIEQLATGFQAVWRRPPTEDELRAMIDDFIREEIYYREALALGLDRDDTVVRRRLRQKMEFLADTGADLLRPAPGDLQAFLVANEQDYRQDPQVAFEQVYLGTAPKPADVAKTLDALQRDGPADITLVGKRTLLPADLRLSPPSAVDGTFGQGFFTRLLELPPGKWAGPAKSAYGMHLVRVTDVVASGTPPLAEVQDAVLRDWKAAKAKEIRERQYDRLQKRYAIEIRGAGAPIKKIAAGNP